MSSSEIGERKAVHKSSIKYMKFWRKRSVQFVLVVVAMKIKNKLLYKKSKVCCFCNGSVALLYDLYRALTDKSNYDNSSSSTPTHELTVSWLFTAYFHQQKFHRCMLCTCALTRDCVHSDAFCKNYTVTCEWMSDQTNKSMFSDSVTLRLWIFTVYRNVLPTNQVLPQVPGIMCYNQKSLTEGWNLYQKRLVVESWSKWTFPLLSPVSWTKTRRGLRDYTARDAVLWVQDLPLSLNTTAASSTVPCSRWMQLTIKQFSFSPTRLFIT